MPLNSRSTRFVFFGVLAALVVLLLVLLRDQFRAPSFTDDDFLAPAISVEFVSFADIDGWADDAVDEAFPAYLKSCAALEKREPQGAANRNENLGGFLPGKTLSGVVNDWLAPCAAAKAIDPDGDAIAVRAFFEEQFAPVKIIARRAPKPDGPAKNAAPRDSAIGKFTGYFEPTYPAAAEKNELHDTPLFARPADLIDVDLGAFRPDLAGERVAGRIDGNKLVPYPDRASINKGALDGAAEPIAWLDANDLFFLQIQGSGRIEFDDGGVLRVGYAGQNGQKYTAIGRTLVQREIMPVEEVSMQSIREWLDAATPAEAQELREQNASYVFFQKLDHLNADEGPLGAQGVPLTPLRSLAVDRRFHMLGAPVFVSISPLIAGEAPIKQLMIAQDTGGAIRGPVRGDFFWGAGADAAEKAGAMNAEGEMIVLLPHSIAAPLHNIDANSAAP